MRILLLTLMNAISIFAFDAFVSAQDLKKGLSNPKLILLDVGTEEDYASGHIPNAQNIKVSSLRKNVQKHQLMRSESELEVFFRSLGINNDSEVVIYGHNKKKESLKAAYTALSLITMGMDAVSILDGGYVEWSYDDSFPITQKTSEVEPGAFTAKMRSDILVDMDYVKKRLYKTPMLEARPPAFYYGTLQSPGVERRGHISGGVSSFWKDKFTEDDMLQTQDVLNEIFFKGYGLKADEEVILYCTGGLEASMNWYVLHQHLKFTSAKMYDGSMREWGNRQDTAVTRYKWEVFTN